MNLFDLAKEHLTIEELEKIISIKKERSQPRPLTQLEILDEEFSRYVTGGDNPKLYPPRYSGPE
tara:strand:+ start:106 stop:297 length:192 start_codon:yes stop_codon:yes gene_type:complete